MDIWTKIWKIHGNLPRCIFQLNYFQISAISSYSTNLKFEVVGIIIVIIKIITIKWELMHMCSTHLRRYYKNKQFYIATQFGNNLWEQVKKGSSFDVLSFSVLEFDSVLRKGITVRDIRELYIEQTFSKWPPRLWWRTRTLLATFLLQRLIRAFKICVIVGLLALTQDFRKPHRKTP